jgi:hypothetical protein
MNKAEAKRLIAKELEIYRSKNYHELIIMINSEPITYELKGEDGVNYQIEIKAFWDDKENGNVRITGVIDDGGWRALIPLSDDFIKSPSGKFVGE